MAPSIDSETRRSRNGHCMEGTCPCEAYVGYVLTADEIAARDKPPEPSKGEDIAQSQLGAILALLFLCRGAQAVLAGRLREACHGSPQMLEAVFGVLRIQVKP